MRYELRCDICGRFCEVADEGVPFGNSSMTEPPDPVFFCKKCATEEYNSCVDSGRPTGGYWIKPMWEKRAARDLGYVLAGPKGAAWATWHKPDRVPADFELWHFDDYGWKPNAS